MADQIQHSLAVVGAGPIGHAAALALADLGLDVALIGPDISAEETRTTALLIGTVRLFKSLEAWPHMEPFGEPLRIMRIVDDTGRLLRAPTVTFNAEEIDEPHFGVNVPVAHVNAALAKTAAGVGRISRYPDLVETIDLADQRVLLTLATGQKIQAQALVAADGRNSRCRQAIGIKVNETRLPQSAIATSFSHTKDHEGISTEFHRKEGPFTTVPMPGNRSALVWMVKPDMVDEIVGQDEADLARLIETRSHGILGKVSKITDIRTYPLTHQTATRFSQFPVALVGEAAHVMPPIGAQGLNLGLRDVAALRDAFEDHLTGGTIDPQSISNALETYHAARRVDVRSRMTAVNILNQSLLTGFIGAQAIRSIGLHAANTIGPFRRVLMREGMLPSYATPRLMRA